MARPTAFVVIVLLILIGWAPSSSVGPSDPNQQPGALYWVFFSPSTWAVAEDFSDLSAVPAQVRFRSEWLRAVSVEVPEDRIHRLAALPGVTSIRPVTRLHPSPRVALVESLAPEPQSLDSIYGGLGESLDAVGIPRAHDLGFSGAGVRIGILDGSFLEDHVTIRVQNPLATRDFVDLDDSPFSQVGDPPGSASHGTALWSILNGNLPGVLTGGAPGAEILLARIRGFDALTPVDEDRWVAGLEWLESQGARIVLSGVSFRSFPSSSHTIEDLDGDSTPATRAADEAARRGVLVVTPVGNNGPTLQSLEAPADGDSVLAVGAVTSSGTPTAFSAAGPTADGREKPDLFAPGLSIQAASALDAQTLEAFSGTEFAAAILAGGLALTVEALPDRSPMELLRILSLSLPPEESPASRMPNVASAILFPDGLSLLPLQEITGEGEVTDLAPQFQWSAPTLNPLGLPVTFHLELSEDSLFQSMVRSDSVVGTFARRPTSPLPARTRLFWRIRARSVQGVERIQSAPEPISVPSWVTLEVLDDPSGSELIEPQPQFRWRAMEVSPPAGPFRFQLEVLSDRESEVIRRYPDLEVTTFTIPDPLPFNQPLRWRVIATVPRGTADTVTSAGPFVITSGANPPATILYQNFPNPFPNTELGRMETRIWFDLAEEGTVALAVYDVRGRLVRNLIPAEGCQEVRLPPGLYGRTPGPFPDPCVTLSWNGLDRTGREVAPGVYLLRLRAGGVVNVRRVVYWP